MIIIYAESGEKIMQRHLRDIRETREDVFTIVLVPEYSLASETTAFDEGADLYFAEPVPVRTLKRLLQKDPVAEESHLSKPPEGSKYPIVKTTADTASTLRTLRDLSHILSFSLDYKAFTQHFILKLRDHISFSRIGIFLESSAKQSVVRKSTTNHLECIASLGLPTDLIDCFQLSRDVGIGKELSERPRILHRQRQTAPPFSVSAGNTEKEFAILGCDIAIPISDREGSIGIAVLNGPVTGRSFIDDELELLYVLMEELGLAIRNSRLHSELAQHGQLIENVLHSMSSGALVCGEDLQILYTNDAARRFLRIENSDTKRQVDFAELPHKLASPIHRAVEKGELPEPFEIDGPEGDGIFRVSIFPFTQKGELVLLPRPTMVIVEDFTKIEANKQSAVDSTKEKLISLIAERFAHEIRNSLVPLSTHAQLIDKKIDQPNFQASLKNSIIKETARIKRFSEQMLYMAQSSLAGSNELALAQLVEDAFDRARSQLGNSSAQLTFDNQSRSSQLKGNSEALTYAIEELFINSMQAAPDKQEIKVVLTEDEEGILRIKLRDGGSGLSSTVIEQAAEPFFTTRYTGVGLGLSVANKIVSEHGGYLRLYPRDDKHEWDVEIELPSLLIPSTR